jgi:multiple sugar transport system permease protein
MTPILLGRKTLLVSELGGYGFARFTFPGMNLLLLATLAILMVPYATILIPLYVLLDRLGLQSFLAGLSLVFIMFQLPFAFAPLILISDASKLTMPVAVNSMQQRGFGATDRGALEAGLVVMALPCLLAFLLLQRHDVRGFMTGALRG